MSSMPSPSPVLMIRSVPQGVNEKDLEAWAKSYTMPDGYGGTKNTSCVKTLLLSDKMIGFVQMGDIEEAKYIMGLYQERPDQMCMTRPNGTHLLNLIYSDKQEIRAQPRARNQIPTSHTRILLVVLKDLSATIMMDELFWIFSQFGVVGKLSSFTKNLKNQILVQYDSKEQASAAMSYLNGRQITFHSPSSNGQGGSGSCKLAILPSKLPELTFKNQDQKNRDYTQINGQLNYHFLQHANSGPNLKDTLTKHAETWRWRIRDFLWGRWVLGDGWLDPKQDKQYQGVLPPPKQGIPEGQIGDCVHISEITKDSVANHGDFSALQIWKICGMYGEIVAVKMLFKYEGSAIVQFSNSEYAKACIKFLGGTDLWGRKWDVKESKNANAMHWSGANTELETRMCTAEKNKAPALPPIYNFAEPSNCLLLWDIPSWVTEEYLIDLFSTQGKTAKGTYGNVRSVELDKTEHTAEVVMDSKEDSLVAASLLNGTRVTDPENGEYLVKLHFDKRDHEDDDAMPRTQTAVEHSQSAAPFMVKTWTA